MTTGPESPGEDPGQLLSSTRELTRRVRRTQRGTWFPLVVFAAVTFIAIPVYHSGGPHLGNCVTVPGGRVCTAAYSAGVVYWPIALVMAYLAIAAFYIRRSRARGVGTRVRPYVIAGIVFALAVTGAALWAFHHPLAYGQGAWAELLARLVNPAFAIGLALLVLAWAERNRALLILVAGYLAVVLVPVSLGWVIDHRAWAFLPQLVIDGSALLLAGIGFALAQRPWRHAT
ncbi:MAG TPA: hypothetical protein VH637_11470 [Streptosporangiaceae bacterium]|jgi:hypothetical protein